MSKSDKMFKKLECKLEETECEGGQYIIITKKDNVIWDYIIVLNTKTLLVSAPVEIEHMKAIMQKYKELGWL